MLTLAINFFMAAILRPSTDYRKQSVTCLQYLVELFARGTPIIEEDGLRHKAFGIYDEQLVSKTEGLKQVESSVNGMEYQRFYERLYLRYFGNSIQAVLPNPINEASKTTHEEFYYEQFGVHNLLTANTNFKTTKNWEEIVIQSTNQIHLTHGTLLFALNKTLSMEGACSLRDSWGIDKFGGAELLETYAWAIRTGDNENSPVIFVKTDNYNSPNDYIEKISKMLNYLLEHNSLTTQLLNSNFLSWNNTCIKDISDYINKNGINVIGYVSIDNSSFGDTLEEKIKDRIQDNTSNLVEINNGVKVFL